MKLPILIFTISIITSLTVILIGLTLNQSKPTNDNITIKNDIQVIEITAKNGYQPKNTIAKANIPTIIKINGNNNFDCSAFVTIPSLNLSDNLIDKKYTEFNIGPQKPSQLKGSCSMGMYKFNIQFE